MNAVVRNIGAIPPQEQHVYESVLGQPLRDGQQVFVQLINSQSGDNGGCHPSASEDPLAQYAIWSDLNDREVSELERAILQRSESRRI